MLGMYLMKRAGFSTEGYIATIMHLPGTSTNLNPKIVSLFYDHPEAPVREKYLREKLPILEDQFKSQYEVETTNTRQKGYYLYNTILTALAFLNPFVCGCLLKTVLRVENGSFQID